jgi:hypothetical protein
MLLWHRVQAEALANALIRLLAEMLETVPERLDPKDVMRFHRPSYEALSGTGFAPWEDRI